MKKLIAVLILAIVLCLVTSCSNKQNTTAVYSFSGENETLIISNGIIIITSEMEKLIGGNISFKNEELLGVKEYNTRLYYNKSGEDVILLSNHYSIQGSDDGMNIQPDLGTSSSESLFSDNEMELIEKSINFSLTGKFLTDEKFEYKMPLDVTKVY